MRESGPSRTAIGVAIHRAAHQTLDHPPVFVDPFAERVLGSKARAKMESGKIEKTIFASMLRAFLAIRSRVAEDTLAEAMQAGVRQYVVLGAGLDTFGLRNADPSLQVFEVDHPNTQTWKRQRIEEEGLPVRATLHFVTVDFTRQEIETELLKAGLDPAKPTFFSWLGVVQYLEPAAIRATLAKAAKLSGPSGGIVFDFLTPPGRWQLLVRLILWSRGRRVARLGEPFKPPVPQEEMRRWLVEAGFDQVELLTPAALTGRYLSGRNDALRLGPLNWIAVARKAGRRS
ncbi:MAG TPA: class I SAM-dependent methyltransferase [Gemmatimonadales bacterium]|nr:class I SAM-dependent methyltransferase [Gemmatimonadales bacterium]